MREYLTNQMVEKKKMGEYEKKLESHQLSIWNKENEDYFRKEKETNERVRTYLSKVSFIYFLGQTIEYALR